MTIPSMPTDNLYKFVTVLGVALVAFSSWMSISHIDRAGLLTAQAEARVELIKDESNSLSERLNSLLDRIEAEIAKPEPDKGKLEFLVKQLEQLKTERQRLIARHEEMWTEDAPKVAEAENLLRGTRLLGAPYFMGLFLAISGIWSWYANHQRYQDAILRKQAITPAAPKKSPRKRK